MKIPKRIIAFTLVLLSVISITQWSALAFRVGDKLGNVLNTDIKAYINETRIACYAVDNNIYVIAEDLSPYGFDVAWDKTTRSLSITYDSIPNGNVKPVIENANKSGSIAFSYVYTDIVTYINGNLIDSFSIQGYTVICIDDLAKEFGSLKWNGAKRELKLTTKYSMFSGEELARIKEINKMLSDIAPKAKSTYISEANITTQSLGKLTQPFLDDGLAYINFARYMAGLPTVALSDEFNNFAQHGAYVLLATGQFTHYPTNTVNLPDSIFSAGRAACETSNLGLRISSLYDFNRACMDDSDSSNISNLGHRRWLLCPEIGYIGMGFIRDIAITYIFDDSNDFTDWDTINWPPAGVFPKSEFYAHTAWSVSLGENYKAGSSTQVKITRQGDGATWTLSNNSVKTGREYFNIESTNYGRSGSCIIFRPDIDEYKSAEEYKVTITGLTGKSKEISYTVKFF